jgi:hypothetical protein
MKRLFSILLIVFGSFLWAQELRVDTEEIQITPREPIEFENYEGVPEKIETRDQIRGIGRSLAGKNGRYSIGRYSIIHAIDSQITTGFDADIFILEPTASVDHIRNLRWMLGSYLEEEFGYGRADGDLLAEFITIYNAVYRKNIAYFTEKYKPVVLSYLDPEKVGLAKSYREWPGGTQILIPLSAQREKGLLSLNTRALTESPVIEDLRQREDRGIELRKEMINLKERQIEEEEKELAQEKLALKAAKEQIEKAEKEEVSSAKPSVHETAPSTPPETVPLVITRESGKESITALKQIEEEKKEIASREEEIRTRELEIEEKKAEVREERKEIARDQQELLQASTLREQNLVPFILFEKEGGRMVLVQAETGEVVLKSTEYPLTVPFYPPFGTGYRVVASRGGVGGKLLLLDPSTLKEIISAREETYGKGAVKVLKEQCFTVIREGNSWYIGKYDSSLALLERSRIQVLPETFLEIHGSYLYVQTPEGKVVPLKLEGMK